MWFCRITIPAMLIYFVYLISIGYIEIAAVIATFSAVIVALFKEDVHNALFPPILIIDSSESEKHLKERATSLDNNDDIQCWLGISIKNAGYSTAKNVCVYFKGIESNRIASFGSYMHLQLRREHLEPRPEWRTLPIIVPPKMEYYYGFCHINKNAPNILRFSFSRTPTSFQLVRCPLDPDEPYYFEFDIIVVSDNCQQKTKRFIIEYSGGYKKTLKIRTITKRQIRKKTQMIIESLRTRPNKRTIKTVGNKTRFYAIVK